MTGTLVLDDQHQADARFVFRIGSALTTASGSVVSRLNADGLDGVFWQMGRGSLFACSLLADQRITLNTGASMVCGRVLALEAAVTLDSNSLAHDCQDVLDPVVVQVPEPASWALVALALAGLGWRRHLVWRRHLA